VVSQVITLYLTPVVYTYMARWVKTRMMSATAMASPATARELLSGSSPGNLS
jgi:hypothetical protein